MLQSCHFKCQNVLYAIAQEHIINILLSGRLLRGSFLVSKIIKCHCFVFVDNRYLLEAVYTFFLSSFFLLLLLLLLACLVPCIRSTLS